MGAARSFRIEQAELIEHAPRYVTASDTVSGKSGRALSLQVAIVVFRRNRPPVLRDDEDTSRSQRLQIADVRTLSVCDVDHDGFSFRIGFPRNRIARLSRR